MKLTTAQNDRAAGVLLGQACGDALGVPYEFGRPPGAGELAEMTGGGLGNFEPGEWSDDTSMAVAVADGLPEGLDAVADGFLRWYDGDPADVGIQTGAVLAATRRRLAARQAGEGETGSSRVMAEEAATHSRSNPHSAGNGALMRTSPVALAHLFDRVACAETARGVALLTHGDPLAGDSCVLWSEAIRVAVIDGRIDVLSGLDLLPASRRDQWRAWLDEATQGPASRFNPNGFTVSALQAALAAISSTAIPAQDAARGSFACGHFQDALHAAVRIGHDTDTVAAIVGGLLGARWGASAVPWRWRRAVHGWPGRDGRDLVAAAYLLTHAGAADPMGWPPTEDVTYTQRASARVVPHPEDPGVLLGTHRTHRHDATAVVSMCRVGRSQSCFQGQSWLGKGGTIVESRLMDSDDPAANPNLAFSLYDAADAVRGLREEGHIVLLHCVAAHQRTPSVAVAYSRLLGVGAEKARLDVRRVLASTRGSGAVWDAAGDVTGDVTGEGA